jgi:Predicted membrane protein involved in D-alanine export
MWGYSLQIYADFSGYTDIAIGLSCLMGFTLLPNFNSPYKAISVADFWRRWHKSLGFLVPGLSVYSTWGEIKLEV